MMSQTVKTLVAVVLPLCLMTDSDFSDLGFHLEANMSDHWGLSALLSLGTRDGQRARGRRN
jgi:hypothetical protein